MILDVMPLGEGGGWQAALVHVVRPASVVPPWNDTHYSMELIWIARSY